MSRFTVLAAVFVLTCPLWAQAKPAADETARAYAAEAMKQASSPRSAAMLLRMHALVDEVEDLTPLLSTYAYVASRRSSDPNTRATAQMLLLDTERARGRLVRANEVKQWLGYVGDYYVTGGFENEGKAGCDTDFGPEAANLDLSASYPAAKGGNAPIKLLLKYQGGFRTVAVDYHGGLRYPHLQRIEGTPDYLGDIIAARR